MTLGNRIREARRGCGMSQSEFARAINQRTKGRISKSLISMWERGDVKNPTIEHLQAIVAVTGVAHDWLMSGKGPKKTDLSAALDAARGVIPLDRAALATAVQVVFEKPPGGATKAAEIVLSLYDILVESPATDLAALRRMAAILAKAD